MARQIQTDIQRFDEDGIAPMKVLLSAQYNGTIYKFLFCCRRLGYISQEKKMYIAARRTAIMHLFTANQIL